MLGSVMARSSLSDDDSTELQLQRDRRVNNAIQSLLLGDIFLLIDLK
jgi:hypothetical protein